MSFWQRLFAGWSAATNSTTAKKGSNWYFAENKDRTIRQVVLTSDPKRKMESRFSSLMLSPVWRLMDGPLITGFFRLDGDPGPYLMIRTDGARRDGYEAVDEMANHQFKVAFSFVHLPTSGLVAVFISSKFLKDNTRMGYLEQFYGLDKENTRALISDAVDKDSLYVVHARDSGMLRCKYDVAIPLDAACKRVLADQWKALLAHHKQITGPDFEAAGRRLYQLIPEGTDPILRM